MIKQKQVEEKKPEVKEEKPKAFEVEPEKVIEKKEQIIEKSEKIEQELKEEYQKIVEMNEENLVSFLQGCFINPNYPRHLLLIYSFKLGGKDYLRAKEVSGGAEKTSVQVPKFTKTGNQFQAKVPGVLMANEQGKTSVWNFQIKQEKWIFEIKGIQMTKLSKLEEDSKQLELGFIRD